MQMPKKINLGSGKNFREDYLNIDVQDYWSPDIVTDISKPITEFENTVFSTNRFGDVCLERGQFDEIICCDVLEHVPDLTTAMTNCLELLKTGGKLRVIVPYDLSYGAWQDPTHVRAFNECSWLYYTDWFWYLNWRTHRFVTRDLDFVLNPIGQKMLAAGQPQDVIIRTPRAVDMMKITLEKIELSAQDQEALAKHQKARPRAAELASAG